MRSICLGGLLGYYTCGWRQPLEPRHVVHCRCILSEMTRAFRRILRLLAQSFQKALTKECALNHMGILIMASGTFLNEALLEALGPGLL